MAELLHEIWRNPEDNSFACGRVAADSDALRERVEPKSVCIHSFKASSASDSYRKMHALLDYGEWVPHPGFEEHLYTDDEEQEQRLYLRTRQSRRG